MSVRFLGESILSNNHQELLRRVDELTDDYHQEKLDHARESHFNRDVQQREIRLQSELQKYKALMVRRLCQIKNM